MIYILQAETLGCHLVLAKTALPHAAQELFRRLGGVPLGFSEAAYTAQEGDMASLASFFLQSAGDYVWMQARESAPVLYTMTPTFETQSAKERH